MIFNKTDRLGLKFIGNTFGQPCEFSLAAFSYTVHAELIVMTDSPLSNDLEIKTYNKTFVIPYSEVEYDEHAASYTRTFNVTGYVPYAGDTTFPVRHVSLHRI